MGLPQLSFFCELGGDALVELFAEPAVIANLQALKAGISLGILDLSSERAGVVRRLNRAGVPVVAWLLLPEEQGYWLNLDNVEHAVARYDAILAWTAEHDLVWDGVGLDIEPHSDEVKLLFSDPLRLFPDMLGRLFEDESRLRHGEAAFDALVRRIRADGYRIESYQLPFIVDERLAKSTLFRRLSGLAQVSADVEVLMLYSSMYRPFGPALIESYGPEAGAIGVGSTGGGVDFGDIDLIAPLSWQELVRDLSMARQLGVPVHVISLEGCVSEDHLSRLVSMTWSAAPAPASHPYVICDLGAPAATRRIVAEYAPLSHPGGAAGGAMAGWARPAEGAPAITDWHESVSTPVWMTWHQGLKIRL